MNDASCIYCSGISDLKEAVRNGWYTTLRSLCLVLYLAEDAGDATEAPKASSGSRKTIGTSPLAREEGNGRCMTVRFFAFVQITPLFKTYPPRYLTFSYAHLR